jgi:uncharacterized protein YndB with AHSA1/START domain
MTSIFLTAKDLLARWNLGSLETIRLYRIKRGLKSIQIGGSKRYKLEDVEDFENQGLITPKNKLEANKKSHP